MNDFPDFIQETLTIIDTAQKKGIPLRLLGALAVYYHCPKFRYLYGELKREPSDIDLISYSKFNEQILNLLSEKNYIPNKRLIAIYGRKRHVYTRGNRTIDIFFDKLEMCHSIDFKNRLEIDYPTISLADLFLTKLQIVKLTEKDIKDSIILLMEHDVDHTDKDTINVDRITKLLSSDWGFYHTAMRNLKKIKEYSSDYKEIEKKDYKNIVAKIEKIIDAIENEPKTLKWKLRAKIGERIKWYQEVE